MGSFPQPWTLLPPLSAAAVALVRGITDGPERRSARRQIVLGDLGQVADCREPPPAPRVKLSLELRSALSGTRAVRLKPGRNRVAWSVKVTEEYAAWFTALIKEDLASATQVAQAVAALREEGPALGRPLVDRIQGSRIHHLKELRPGSAGRSEIRVLFAFDPTRSALLLLGGDKAGNWQRWYRQNIPIAEQLYLEYTTEQQE
jgi:hypothetical protein